MLPDNHKFIGWVIAIGSLLFLIAAFGPYARVFGNDPPEKKLEIITRLKIYWDIGHIFFGGGAVITVAGLSVLAFGMKNVEGGLGAQIGSILMIVGGFLWFWSCLERISSPEGFIYGNNTPYLFAIYSVLTQVGMVMVGWMLLNADMADWIGWMFTIGGIALFVLMVIFKDMPPFVYYIITSVLAINLIRH